MNNKECKILFENGTCLQGRSLGLIGTTGGEVCFNTSMTGYQEILTDPSYSGQVVNMTYPHIGNYGVNDEDIESNKVQCSGFIVKEASEFPSNFRSKISLDKYLEGNKIVGIQGVDTRMITRMIRDEGAMNAAISSSETSDEELYKTLKNLPDMTGLDLAKKVSCEKSYHYNKIESPKYRIAALDFGIKENILRIMSDLSCEIRVFPATTESSDIMDYNPDGIFLSNGPGDPAACTYAIKTVKELLGYRPIFGICLGHQILGLSLDAKTFKMKFGHRGANNPVKNLETSVIEITSQNHGFSIDHENLPGNIEVTHVNLNDNTIEGIRCKEYNVYSVQHHPEASPGPHDSRYLFDDFIRLMDGEVNA